MKSVSETIAENKRKFNAFLGVKRMFASLCFVCALGSYANCAATQSRSEFTLANGAKIAIVEDVFDKTKHKIGVNKDNIFVLIDGKKVFGMLYHEAPKTYVKSITATYQGETYNLEASDMYNAWGDRLKNAPHTLYFWGQCVDKYNCTFRGLFGDASYAFEAEWKIINAKSVRTMIGNSMEVGLSVDPALNAYANNAIKTDAKKIGSAVKLNLADANVTIKKDSFNESKFKIEKCDRANAICLINDRVPLGVSLDSFKVPKTYLKNIVIAYNGANYNLDVSDMYDMDLVDFGGTCREYLCFFRGIFSNGENYFAAQWSLDAYHKYTKRSALTFSSDVVDEFLKHIDANLFYN
ncbi:MAG: hypothetical protein LBO72_10110 [Helicobacteraceae bacterium]|jgi:hypothetical protein|nr:hypothetical protein [Helicobacteraceae bacterium]